MAAAPRSRRSRHRWGRCLVAVSCSIGLLTPATALADDAPAADALATEPAPETASTAALPDTLAVSGHGWGHGRGLGQYGSFGYATGRSGGPWSYSTILGHYYGGTTVGHINDNPSMAVLLKARGGQAMVIYRETGLKVPGVEGAPTAVRVTLRADGDFDVQTGTTCKNTGASPAVQVEGPVRVEAAPDSGTLALRLCNSDGSAIAYRGALVAFDTSARNVGMETVNLVHMDDLMRGVVPRESPASWGDAEGGLGMHALRAQAVAARSYAAAGDTRWGNLHAVLGARATTCDDTFCQVYGGLASISPAETGTPVYRTDDRTDRAVAETAGEVRISSSGGVARTEFSSSTGGWTAGGTFPPVVDEGDAVSANPNHAWSGSLSRATIEGRYPAIGSLSDIQFNQRNGLGSMGGRVLELRLQGSEGYVELTGNQFRSAFSLKSDWFNVTVPPPPSIQPRSIDTACPASTPSGAFEDVPADNPHRRAIDCVASYDIANGTSPGRFSPTMTVTRAQMASFVARMIEADGGPLPESPPDAFDDDDGSVHERAINQLADVGIVNGISPGIYAPGQPIDRAQLASILARAVTHLDVTLAAPSQSFFSDDNDSVHESAIDKLAAEGVVAGTSPGKYQPNATARRDQMASMLARALDLAMDE